MLFCSYEMKSETIDDSVYLFVPLMCLWKHKIILPILLKCCDIWYLINQGNKQNPLNWFNQIYEKIWGRARKLQDG